MTHIAARALRILLLAGLMTVLLAVSAAAVELPTGVGAVTGSSVRMRSRATTSSSILTTMDKGTAVAVWKKTGNWYRISYNGKTGYVHADYLVLDRDGKFTTYGRVSGSDVNLRADATTKSAVVTVLKKGTALTVTGFADGWYSITRSDGISGYIRSDLLALDLSAKYAATQINVPTSGSTVSGSAEALISMAREFMGVRYVYGGSGPKSFDCSGFTMYLCRQFGISLPHSATSQWQSGKGTKVAEISSLLPGDLVYFCDPSRSNGKACSHCGVYLGNGQFIHASSSKAKVVISDLTSGYYNRYFVGGLRMF